MHFTHPGQDGHRHHQQKDAEKARTVPTACRSSFLSLSSLYAYPSLSYLSDAPMSHSNSSRPSTSQNSPQHSQTIAWGASTTPAQKEDIPHLLSFLRRRRWRGWGRECECECVCVRGGGVLKIANVAAQLGQLSAWRPPSTPSILRKRHGEDALMQRKETEEGWERHGGTPLSKRHLFHS